MKENVCFIAFHQLLLLQGSGFKDFAKCHLTHYILFVLRGNRLFGVGHKPESVMISQVCFH